MINAVNHIEASYQEISSILNKEELPWTLELIRQQLKRDNKTINIAFDNSVLVNLNKAFTNEVYFGVLYESPDILEWYHKYVFKQQGSFFEYVVRIMSDNKPNNFKTLYTFDKRYKGVPNVIVHPMLYRSSIRSDNHCLYEGEKNNLVTFITSNKNHTRMQSVRTRLAYELSKLGIDVYGKGYKEIDCKSSILRNSMFCYAIENGIYAGYHSEKIIDCFVTGCVPIYMGDPDISDHYDKRGILVCKNENELIEISNSVTADLYADMLPYIKKNFQIAAERSKGKHLETIIPMMYRELY